MNGEIGYSERKETKQQFAGENEACKKAEFYEREKPYGDSL
jgi:hypothetical protein